MVIGHTSIPKIGNQWIYSFHMPLFFFLSGYLFNPYKYSINQFIVRKIKTFIIPYFFFLFLNWIICEFLEYKQYPPFSLTKVLCNGSNSALWFIYVLLFTETLFFIIFKLKKTFRFLPTITIFLLPIFGWIMFQKNIHFPYKIEVIGLSSIFYIIGYFSNLRNLLIFTHSPKFLIFLFILSVFLSYYQIPRLDMACNCYGMGIPTILVAFLGIYTIIKISQMIQNNFPIFIKKLIIYIGENTIVVVGMSSLISMSMKKYFEIMNIPTYISSTLRHILLWFILILFIKILTRYTPILIGKK